MQQQGSASSSSTTTTTVAPVTLVLRRKQAPPTAPPPPTKHEHIEWAPDVVEINEFSGKRKSKSAANETPGDDAMRMTPPHCRMTIDG